MTVAQLKGMKGKISDVQLNKYLKMASQRDGVQLTQIIPSKAPITHTRTNGSKPDAVANLINKEKEKEHRAQLNELLLKYKGMTLVKVEENTGHFNDDEVVELTTKIKNEMANKPTKPEKKSNNTNEKIPLSKMTLAQLQEVKGTISDVQWNKYAKMASKREGGVVEIIPTKGKAKTEVREEKKAPVTRTRTAPVEKKSSSSDELAQIVCEFVAKLQKYFEANR
jgi:hypothetical protein